ncbi:Protein of unknown function [Flavobacteriaceae bacterium MAR_2010_188]|nr:Protein of unknown function [Flavobacteriaceae bacterium MAR_2010_188]
MNDINNKALSIQVSLNGLSICIKNTLDHKIEYLSSIAFERSETPYKVQDYLEAELDKYVFKNKSFHSVFLVHRNELSTFVPQEYFQEENLADYLKFNAKILRSDFLSYDNIEDNKSVNVYVPLVNINNLVIDRFGEFIYKHSSTVLIETLFKLYFEPSKPKIFINAEQGSFEMVVFDQQKLVFYNMFEFSTPEDLSYYILFTMEQLNLSVEKTILRFIGGVDRNDANFEIIYKYVRDVDILESDLNLKFADEIDIATINDHYILINSFN